MDMTMSNREDRPVEVITGVQRRRRWTAEQKLAMVKQTFEPGMSVSYVARQMGVATSQLFNWRKAYMAGSLVAVAANEQVVPSSDLQDAMRSNWGQTTVILIDGSRIRWNYLDKTVVCPLFL